ncbi:citrate synthase [Ramlibacter sp. AW1]|uniref:citrate synthase (unknown stereospecificity) n=1 Tax=Ramlibacter aurantiacus TaxID=2801330 RepID=A0A936ZFV3_9BURK|nr:citrate synthase [Ramlibacter aurantiacus]MBL0420729.1 citrate synthase [Ramlibacter aurantiacus]
MGKPDPRKDYLTTAEAVELLGVKPQTLYAYVSRGLVRSIPDESSRSRRYAREDLERVRLRSRANSTPEAVAATLLDLGHPVVLTGITEITPQGPSYRGRLAVSLAREGARFEQVAELLWTGLWHDVEVLWDAPSPATAIGRALRTVDAGTARHQLVELFALVVMRLAMGRGPVQARLLSGRPLDAAREIVQVLAGCFGYLGERGSYLPPRPGRSVAESLLLALGRAPGEADRALLDATLVLLADHELSPGAFSARIAASAGCSVHSCLASAIATSSGTEVGRRYDRIEELLDRTGSTAELAAHARRLIESGQSLTGFEHPVYPQGDPRAACLLELLGKRRVSRDVTRVFALIDAAGQPFGLKPRHELAVVAACRSLRLPRGTPAALFVLARIGGWVAHVLEQRRSSTLIRPRAKFVAGGPG